MAIQSVNEPGYTAEQMRLDSINEPQKSSPGLYAPTITSIVPNTCAVGGPDYNVKITGTGFFAQSQAFVGEQTRVTVYNADGTLTVTLRPSTRVPGTVKVVVRNGQFSSNQVDFTFTATAEEK